VFHDFRNRLLEKPLHHYAESLRPIELPADIVELLQTVATLDVPSVSRWAQSCCCTRS